MSEVQHEEELSIGSYFQVIDGEISLIFQLCWRLLLCLQLGLSLSTFLVLRYFELTGSNGLIFLQVVNQVQFLLIVKHSGIQNLLIKDDFVFIFYLFLLLRHRHALCDDVVLEILVDQLLHACVFADFDLQLHIFLQFVALFMVAELMWRAEGRKQPVQFLSHSISAALSDLVLAIDALRIFLLLHLNQLITSISLLPFLDKLHPAPQFLQKWHFLPLHVNGGHFLLNGGELEVEFDDWILAGLIPIKLHLLHFDLLAVHGSILIEMEEEFLGRLALGTLLLVIEDHFVIDEGGGDLVISLQVLLVELLLEGLRRADLVLVALRLLVGQFKLAERIMDDLDVAFAVLTWWQVAVVLDAEGAAVVVEVIRVLQGISVGLCIELLVAEQRSRYINWWFFLMKLRQFWLPQIYLLTRRFSQLIISIVIFIYLSGLDYQIGCDNIYHFASCRYSFFCHYLKQQFLQSILEPHLHFLFLGQFGYGQTNCISCYYSYSLMSRSSSCWRMRNSSGSSQRRKLYILLFKSSRPEIAGCSDWSPNKRILVQCSKSSCWKQAKCTISLGYSVSGRTFNSSSSRLWMTMMHLKHSARACSSRCPPHSPLFRMALRQLSKVPSSSSSRNGLKNCQFLAMKVHASSLMIMWEAQDPSSWSAKARNRQLPSPITSTSRILSGMISLSNAEKQSQYSLESLKASPLAIFFLSLIFICLSNFLWARASQMAFCLSFFFPIILLLNYYRQARSPAHNKTLHLSSSLAGVVRCWPTDIFIAIIIMRNVRSKKVRNEASKYLSGPFDDSIIQTQLDKNQRCLNEINKEHFDRASEFLRQIKSQAEMISAYNRERWVVRSLTLNTQAYLLQKQGKLTEALQCLEEAETLETREGASPIDAARTKLNKSVVLSRLGSHQQAVKLAKNALELLRQKGSLHSHQLRKNQYKLYEIMVVSFHNIASELSHLSNDAEALNVYREGYQLALKVLGPAHRLTQLLRSVVRSHNPSRSRSKEHLEGSLLGSNRSIGKQENLLRSDLSPNQKEKELKRIYATKTDNSQHQREKYLRNDLHYYLKSLQRMKGSKGSRGRKNTETQKYLESSLELGKIRKLHTESSNPSRYEKTEHQQIKDIILNGKVINKNHVYSSINRFNGQQEKKQKSLPKIKVEPQPLATTQLPKIGVTPKDESSCQLI